MRIWQCVDGHPVCEKCRVKLDSKGCPSCNRSVEGRNIALGENIKYQTGTELIENRSI